MGAGKQTLGTLRGQDTEIGGVEGTGKQTCVETDKQACVAVWIQENRHGSPWADRKVDMGGCEGTGNRYWWSFGNGKTAKTDMDRLEGT